MKNDAVRFETPGAAAPISSGLVAGLMEEAHRAASAGRRELARQRYEGALYLLKHASEAAAASAILRRVGRTYLDDGDTAAGLDCLEAALAVAEAADNPSEVAHTINVMAISYWQRGLLEEGKRLYEKAARIARDAGDERLVAMVEQNLGVVASIHGDEWLALSHYTESLRRYRALGVTDAIPLLLNNVGMAHAHLRQWEEADEMYTESHRLARECGDTLTRMTVEINRVALMISRRDFVVAKSICDRTLLEAGSLKEKRLLAEAYKHAGVIARETGRADDAENFLRMAFEEAMAREDLLLAAETAREQAELFLTMGRNRATLQALSLSHRLFSQLRAKHDLADVRRRMHLLEQRFESAVQEWAQNIESKDAYTAGHCSRVADYACAIATDLGFDEPTLFWFRVGALLHDVGKIVVHSDILNKPGALTPDERGEMEKHPAAGVELLRDIDFPWDVFPMIRGHHERWDGHGYPDRLAGEDIPLSARILCVADVYDALTSDRPYRSAFSPAAATQLMQADIGRAFDPEILSRFLRIMHRVSQAEGKSLPNTSTEPRRRAASRR